jgi:hypothetical protein
LTVGRQRFGAQPNVCLPHTTRRVNIVVFINFVAKQEEENLTWTTWTSMDYPQEENYKLFLGINGTLSNKQTPLSTRYQNVS